MAKGKKTWKREKKDKKKRHEKEKKKHIWENQRPCKKTCTHLTCAAYF